MVRQYSVSYNKRQCVEADDFDELLKKSCKKFKVSHKDLKLVLDDGTEIDDEYLSCLPRDTALHLVPKLQTSDKSKKSRNSWRATEALINRVWSLPAPPRKNVDSIIKALRTDENLQKSLQRILNLAAVNLKDNKADDIDWFRGIPSHISSKEKWMTIKAKDRIRNYYDKTKEEMLNLLSGSETSNRNYVVQHRLICDGIFRDFKLELTKKDFHSGYFCRSNKQHRLCDGDGWFQCQGEFSEPKCKELNHTINPYGSRETRIMFSTWNLDHKIERSRSIIPALKAAVEKRGKNVINWKYFYKLLFVAMPNETALAKKRLWNLKLVHTVCHIKSTHSLHECDGSKFYLTMNSSKQKNIQSN